MKKVDRIPVSDQRYTIDAKGVARFEEWFNTEFTDISAARHALEAEWNENQRRYEGVKLAITKHIPFENAPNEEFTIGAMVSDALYAQAVDLTFNSISPYVSARSVSDDKESVENAKAFQDWLNWGSENEFKPRRASEHTFLDTIQHGTGIQYIPWEEYTSKTGTHKTARRGPRIRTAPLEDFFITPGAIDIEDAPTVTLRHWLTRGDLALYAKFFQWNIDQAAPAAGSDWVRSNRERIGHQIAAVSRAGKIFEVIQAHCTFDIDGDGVEEDLVAFWDRTSQRVLRIAFSPYQRRPFTASWYQLRAHLFYAMGVMEMTRPYQAGITMFANDWLANSLLANCRMYKGPAGFFPDGTVRAWPGRYLETSSADEIGELKMSDTYPSGFQAILLFQQMSAMRTGVNDSQMNPQASQMFGSRTPGITALSALQQAGKRFTTAYDSMRNMVSDSIMQAQFRYQERLLAGDRDVETHILRVMGDERGQRVISLLRDEDFDESIVVEMAASSASVNREADRQAHLQLLQTVSGYYQQCLELGNLIGSGQLSEGARATAIQIQEKASELVERVIRTYPQIKDAKRFVLTFNEELNNAVPITQDRLGELSRALQSSGGAENGGIGMGGPASPLNGSFS